MKDLAGLMKQAQDMQKKMTEAQARLDEIEVEGVAGAGLVSVTMSAKGEARRVKIDPSAIDAEEPEILEDLVLAAMADAKRKADEASQTLMNEITSGMGLPGGMGIPGFGK